MVSNSTWKNKTKTRLTHTASHVTETHVKPASLNVCSAVRQYQRFPIKFLADDIESELFPLFVSVFKTLRIFFKRMFNIR